MLDRDDTIVVSRANRAEPVTSKPLNTASKSWCRRKCCFCYRLEGWRPERGAMWTCGGRRSNSDLLAG